MPTGPKEQLGFDEKVVEDARLLAALEERETAKGRVRAERQVLTKIDDEVRIRIGDLDLGVDTAVRIGRFRITKTMAEARHVEFDSEAKERISIKLADKE